MTSRQILIRLAHIGQAIDLGDRDLKTARIDQPGKFREHLGIRRRAVAFGLDAVLRGRREVDDRIDPVRRDAESECQLHIAATEGVDEGVDPVSSRGMDPFRDAVPVGDRDHTVVGEPGVIRNAGETKDFGAGIPGQLNGDRADSARGARDDDGVARRQRNGVRRCIGGRSRDEQGTRLLP
jgi:hypothetical protein